MRKKRQGSLGAAVVMVLTEKGGDSLERKGKSRSSDRSCLALGQRGQGRAIIITPLPILSLICQIFIEHLLMSQVLVTHR